MQCTLQKIWRLISTLNPQHSTLLIETHHPHIGNGPLKQKEIRKPITSKNINNNWQIAREEKEKDLRTIFVSEPVEDEEIQEILENIQFEDIQ